MLYTYINSHLYITFTVFQPLTQQYHTTVLFKYCVKTTWNRFPTTTIEMTFYMKIKDD